MLEQDDRVGHQIGNYHVEKVLSFAGGFADVYLGKHVVLDRIVVIKLLRSASQATAQQKKQFLQEARFLETLKHRYILPILDAGIQDEVPYLVTEHAPHGSLSDRLRERHWSPLRIEDALIIILQIGQALQFAHQHNVLHRDLKPDNILFNANNEALLADFGIALKLDTAKTQSVDASGTPAYMAPEQFASKASPKSDQYALGCIAYELFTGRKVFNIPHDADQKLFAWMYQHATAMPVPPTKLNPNLPANIEQAILKALEKNRDDRHIEISAFLAALGLVIPMVSASSGPDESLRTSRLRDENDVVTEPGLMFQQLLAEGDRYYQASRYEEALAAYEQAVRYDARSARAACAMGSTLDELKRYVEASAAYDQAILLDSTFAYAHLGRGNIAFIFKHYDEALTAYKIAVRLDYTLTFGYEMLGKTLNELMRYEEAIAAYEAVLHHNPASIDSYFHIADLNIKLARLPQAISAYDQIIRLKPDMIDTYYKKGALLEQLNRRDEAIATCNQIIILSPRSLDASYKKAELLEKIGRHDEAIVTYNQIIGLNPQALDAYEKKITILKQLQRLEEVITTYNQCITFNPTFIEAYSNKAELLVELLRNEEAIAVYDEIIRLKPNMIDAYRKKLALLEELKRYDEILATYDQIIRVNPTSPDGYGNSVFSAYLEKARLLEELKQFTGAIATYKQMISSEVNKTSNKEWKEKVGYLSFTKLSYRLIPLLCLVALSPIVNIIVIALLFHSWVLLGALFGGTIAIPFMAAKMSDENHSTEDEIGCAAAVLAFLCGCGWGYVAYQLTSSFLIALLVTLANFFVYGFAVTGLEHIMKSPKLSKRRSAFH